LREEEARLREEEKKNKEMRELMEQ